MGDEREQPHERRDIAESFGAIAERYDRARPRYPSALVDRVLGDPPASSVLDVGIGTGISSLPFADAGATVLGVEPDDAMAALARVRGFEVETARFEDWDDRDRRFDRVIAGQAWHWVDPVAGARRAADVLRPGGRIDLFWNVARPPAELAARFAEAYRSVDTGLPFNPWERPIEESYERMLDAPADGIRASGRFDDPVRWSTEWSARTTRDAWLDLVPTAGGHSRIPPGALSELLAEIGRAIDEVGGAFDLPYTTVLVEAGLPASASSRSRDTP